jgi:hypothetical protein
VLQAAVAIWKEYRAGDELRRKSIATRLEAQRWKAFGRWRRDEVAAPAAGGALGVPARAQEGLHTEPVLVLEPGMHTAPIRRLDADAAGRFLVTASDDKTVRVWAAADGALLRTLRLPAGPGNVGKAYAAAISPDGALVAAGGWTSASGTDESVYLFDRASGRLLRRAGGLPARVIHLAFSPDGSRLAAAHSVGRAADRPPRWA